ncbi:hypothetical protein BpHYR1_023030, partial [Brachionus plicatilis]
MICLKCLFSLVLTLNHLLSIFAQTSIHTTLPISSAHLPTSTSHFEQNQTNFSHSEHINATTPAVNSTSTIAATTIEPLIYLAEFKLIKIKYNESGNEFILDYMISSNHSHYNDQKPHYFNISFNCTSEDKQMWSHQESNMFQGDNFLQSSAHLKPQKLDNFVKPGSFIKCTSIAQSENNYLDDSIFFLT